MAKKKTALDIFEGAVKGIATDPVLDAVSSPPETLTERGTLQVVAQMRQAQRRFYAAREKGEKQNYLIDAKRLEAAVDVRLGIHGIEAVKD